MAVAPPSPESGDAARLLAQYLRQQKQLNSVLRDEVTELWPFVAQAPTLNYANWLAAMLALIRQYGLAAAALGASTYTAYRGLIVPARRATKFTPPVAEQPVAEQVAKGLDWATRNLTPDAAPETAEAAFTKTKGVAQRLAQNPARDALSRAASQDPQADGWYRVPSGPHACAFCRLMSTRGPIYKDREAAGAASDRGRGRKGKDFVGQGQFKFHDHCECTAWPYFKSEGWQVPDYVHEWDDDYTAVSDYADDPLKEFRRVQEGREAPESVSA